MEEHGESGKREPLLAHTLLSPLCVPGLDSALWLPSLAQDILVAQGTLAFPLLGEVSVEVHKKPRGSRLESVRG